MHPLDDIFSGSRLPSSFSDAEAFELMRNIGRELKARHVWNKNVYEGNDEVYVPQRVRWIEQSNYALEYILESFTADQCIAAYKVLLQDFLLPFEPNTMSAFDRFSDRHCKDVLKPNGFGPFGEAWGEAAVGSHYTED